MTLQSKLTTPELLGRLRHLWMAIGSVLLGIGLTSPAWLPIIFTEGFVELVFIVVGGAIDIIQVLRSINSPEKKISGARLTGGISPELAGTIRQILTMLGMLLVVFKIPVPEGVANAFTPEGIQLLIDSIGIVLTYISFVLSKNAKEKKLNASEEVEFVRLRRIN